MNIILKIFYRMNVKIKNVLDFVVVLWKLLYDFSY